MNDSVFDASVYLAMLHDEPIGSDAYHLLPSSIISAVNLTEVLTKVKDTRQHPGAAYDLLKRVRRIESFTASQAQIAADLRPQTAHAGLSLGDRACIALAIELNAEIYTADRMWSKISVPCKIHLVR